MKEQRACMHATYTKSKLNPNKDLVLVKERVLSSDGTESSNLKFFYDRERYFYITKPEHRKTHQFKKEYEHMEFLDRYRSTEAEMPAKISKILYGRSGGYASMRDLSESPYVYGTDISITSLTKQMYLDKWPTYRPDAKVATLDLETNVFSERGEIIYGASTFKDRAVLAVSKEWLGEVPEVEKRLEELFEKYLGKYKRDRNITLHIRVVKNDLEVVKTLFRFLHFIKPDFVSIWNMAFDIEKILECLSYHNVDPADIFSDPEVPPEFRTFKWKKDSLIKRKADGTTISKHPADLWHVVTAPSSFYIIDSMCYFKISRVREQARHSYALDAILDEELQLGKLRFTEADAYKGLEWHKFMQTHYKLHYGIYNLFDCIALELLDEKTHDLSRAVLGGIGCSDLSRLTSNPKQLADELHFFLLKQGKVICSTAPDMVEPYDKYVLGRGDWILTLPSHLAMNREEPFIQDLDDSGARLYSHVYDLDIASGYPTTGVVLNISKETTLVEVSEIVGLTEEQQRRASVNMTAIKNNAVDLGQTLYGLPSLSALLKEYTAALK